MRISDWSSDVCSSDLKDSGKLGVDRKTEHAKYPVQTCALYGQVGIAAHQPGHLLVAPGGGLDGPFGNVQPGQDRSEEHTSELQSLLRISYAVFCLHKKNYNNTTPPSNDHKNYPTS